MTTSHYPLPKDGTTLVLFLRGLPASGKSTKCLATLAAHPAGTVARINNDDIARSVFGTTAHVNAPHLLAQARNAILDALLQLPHVKLILVDNTNLNPSSIRHLARIADRHGARIEVDDSYLDVDIEELIRRDALRAAPVGEDVIRKMAREISNDAA